jgi:cytidylate kinase
MVITISASYGAGGSWIGPQVAERLGYRFVDRAIPAQVAERLGVSVDHAQAHDEAAHSRLAQVLARMPNTAGLTLPDVTDKSFCRETETLLREVADAGDAVVLGRAAAIVLHDRPNALHVRLDGPEDARILQAMRVEEIDEEEARKRQRTSDPARIDYVKHFYRADPRDPGHYHLVIDSTALPLETCVELIATAARGRSGG